MIGDITSGEVVNRFSAFANPGELLTEFIAKLTGIKQSDVDSAGTLQEAYVSLDSWLHPYAAQRQLNPLTWGGGDSSELREALNMGEEYLLASIAVVVIGGTSVAGGRANVPGIWGAALFLYLLVTMLNTFGVSSGPRLIFTGLIIIAVIVIAGGEKQAR